MAFVTPTTLAVGDPLKKERFDREDSNIIDHESRINSLEASSKKIDVFKFLLLNGSSFSSATGLDYFKSEDSFTITKASIEIFDVGSMTGFIEIDILKSTTDKQSASFSSIFTTKPKIDLSTATNDFESINQVINGSAANIAVGDYLRLDITISPVNLPRLLITCYGE